MEEAAKASKRNTRQDNFFQTSCVSVRCFLFAGGVLSLTGQLEVPMYVYISS